MTDIDARQDYRLRQLPTRVYHALRRYGFTTDTDAASLSDYEFLKMRDVGKKALAAFRAIFPNPEPTIESLLAERDALRGYAWEVEGILTGVDVARHGVTQAVKMMERRRTRHGVSGILSTPIDN